MKVLFQGIYNLFNAANSLKTALSGRLYQGKVPQNTRFPYGVYNLDSKMPDFRFGGTTYEDILLMFNYFSEESSASEITDIATYSEALFENTADISVSGYSRVKFQRELEIGPYQDIDEETWQYDVQYRVMLRKN